VSDDDVSDDDEDRPAPNRRRVTARQWALDLTIGAALAVGLVLAISWFR